jgi:flavin reductase (DIM6/NTAB) family NADH-FMN oxidoreductase RutF
MRSFTPADMETPQLHGLLLSAVAPRPIAFVSTIDDQGRPNLAPFSFFNVFSANPPIAIFSPARRVKDNTTKHTLKNVKSNLECVINVVSYSMLHQMNLASCEFAEGVNEFEKAGLTGIPSDIVSPLRVKEAPVQLECIVKEVMELGSKGGAGNLVISEVVRMHVSEQVFAENGNIDPQKLDLIARMGQDWYCRAHGDAIFEVPKPGRELGIGVDAIPMSTRNSSILTGNDLGRLGMASTLPTREEVLSYLNEPSFQGLLTQHGTNSKQMERLVHQTAHQLLEQGKTAEAWKMLLALELI